MKLQNQFVNNIPGEGNTSLYFFTRVKTGTIYGVKDGTINCEVEYGAGAKAGVVYTRQNIGWLLGDYRYGLKDGVKNYGAEYGVDIKNKT